MDDYIKYGIIVGLVIGAAAIIVLNIPSEPKYTPEEVQQIINQLAGEAELCIIKYPLPEYVVEQGECIRKITERDNLMKYGKEYEKIINQIQHEQYKQQELTRIAGEQRQERLKAKIESTRKAADTEYNLTIQECRGTYLGQMEKLQKCLEGAEETRQRALYYYP